jgi:high-affinity iron transporter
MLLTLLIVWRESFEAALVVAILLTFLARTDRRAAIRHVWTANLAGIAAAVPCAAGLGRLLDRLAPETQALAQSQLLFMAAAVLFSTVLWMHDWAKAIRRGRGLETTLATRRIVVIAFVAVFWETVEAMLFLRGAGDSPPGSTAFRLVGAGIAGGALAVATVWFFVRGFSRVPLERYLWVTSVLLLVVAVGLLASALEGVSELGYLPLPGGQLSWLGREEPVGTALRIVAGYRPQTSPLEILAVLLYVPAVPWALWCRARARDDRDRGVAAGRRAAPSIRISRLPRR